MFSNSLQLLSIPMFDSSRGRLLQCLTLSLVLHAGLLLSIASVIPVRLEMPIGTINVVLVGNRLAAPASLSSAKSAVTRNMPRPDATMTASSRRFVERETAAPVAIAHPAPSAAQDAVADLLSSAGATNVALAVPGTLSDGVSADDLRQYRLSLAIAARRFKRYPALARERGWEGMAEVAVSVNPLRPAPEAVLVQSSGQAALDEQAVEMVVQAARSVTVPEALRGHDVRVLLPVRFSLEAGQ